MEDEQDGAEHTQETPSVKINCKIRVAPSKPPTNAEKKAAKQKARDARDADMSKEKKRGNCRTHRQIQCRRPKKIQKEAIIGQSRIPNGEIK